MSNRAMIVVNNPRERERAAALLARVPFGTRVEFKETQRSLPQNARMWVMLTDLAHQLTWHGQRLSTDDWKLVMLDYYWRGKRDEERGQRAVRNVDGTGFVDLGRSTSDLSKEEMTEFQDMISAFGAQHGVVFTVEQDQ